MKLKVHIDSEFRKGQFLAGVELPAIHETECDIAALSPEQRAKILEQNGDVPLEFTPAVPYYDQGADKILNRAWKASLNPQLVNAASILDEWQNDCAKARKVAEKEYDKR